MDKRTNAYKELRARRLWLVWLFIASVLSCGIAIVIGKRLVFEEYPMNPSSIPFEERIITPTPTVIPSVSSELKHYEGTASWYGSDVDSCLGCKPYYTSSGNVYFITASGDILDDDKKTVACGVGGSCKWFPLGSRVQILNLDNNMIVEATVTDTGGLFVGTEKEKILDITPAVLKALNGEGNINVRVTKL